MGAEQHRLAAAAEVGDEILDLLRSDRIHAAGGLVEDQELRVVDQALREPDPPLHPLGELPHGPVLDRVEPHHLEQHVDPLAAQPRGQAEQPAVVVERLAS